MLRARQFPLDFGPFCLRHFRLARHDRVCSSFHFVSPSLFESGSIGGRDPPFFFLDAFCDQLDLVKQAPSVFRSPFSFFRGFFLALGHDPFCR